MKKLYLLTLILAIFASCSTTSDVVSSKRIQKRKYTKGFNIKSHNNNHILATVNSISIFIFLHVVFIAGAEELD